MDNNLGKKHYDVIVIGGGATGAGTARDCAIRGLSNLFFLKTEGVVASEAIKDKIGRAHV